MTTISFDQFGTGLDHRKSSSVADADRLRELTNAYITTGNVIRKRPGLPKIALLEAGTKGLVSGNGKLNTFYDFGSPVTHADTRFLANPLEHSIGLPYAGGVLTKIHYGDVFLGFLYVAAEYADGSIFHYYVDTTSHPNRVVDVNCPNTKAIVKQASRLFAVDGDTVRHCALLNPLDWSTITVPGLATDAGFLATGLQAKGATEALALGQYDGRLATFFVDSMQLWEVGTDAVADILFYKNVEGVGCRFPKTPVIFAGDVMFLAKSGFRSITTQSYTTNLTDVDVGSPIDTIVRKEITNAIDPVSVFFSAQNQFWCAHPVITDTSKTRVWVYTYSKSTKVAAWSKYEIAHPLHDIVTHDGGLYFRTGDEVLQVDETDTIFTDNGAPYEMRVAFPFIDCKTPSIDKHFATMDLTVLGTVDVQFKYDPNDETKLTDPITLTGDSRPLQAIPLEITATAIAPVFTSTSDALVQIDAFAFNFMELNN